MLVQNELLDEQNKQVKMAYGELKSAQAQLIQSEKMASLGELTAGIAHEIQNPLNFVNNFAEVNRELIDEMKDEIAKGNLVEVNEIAIGIDDNSAKISEHGKRADSIVKSMLFHSRVSSGQKELTDINSLADEYFRLAYHGLRAKDKSFNATVHTNFDDSIGKVNIIPQDIGRVLLNIYNNAFYAVMEKQKTAPAEYKPEIEVSTGWSNDVGNNLINNPQSVISRLQRDELHPQSIKISIKDNGTGIPKNVQEKIFQPFFTTKPTGQGTGLGLSLSYDIIKAHGGQLHVETKEGEYSIFVISLPVI